MNTQHFITSIRKNPGMNLEFQLPDGDILSGDLHITEIKHQNIDSIDCGKNAHSFRETVVQLWINERSGKQAEWSTDKALSIIEKVGEVQPYTDEAELFIEFGDSTHPTIKYSVKEIRESENTLRIDLFVNPTVCKPALLSGTTAGCC